MIVLAHKHGMFHVYLSHVVDSGAERDREREKERAKSRRKAKEKQRM